MLRLKILWPRLILTLLLALGPQAFAENFVLPSVYGASF